jgi:cytochrome c-type biogenesis protein CcmH
VKNSLRAFACCLLLFTQSHAASIEQPLADPAQEHTARAIFHELKCVVCEGQSLADSDAALAKNMRSHVRQLLADGKSHAEIIEFFRTRYGEEILLAPPFTASTWLLWLAPLLLLLAGGALVWRATQPAKEDRP